MTVIAWDGKTLAADRMAAHGCLARTVTKIWKVRDMLVGGSGSADVVQSMLWWVRHGCDPDRFPAMQNSEEFAPFLVIKADGIWLYERTPNPIEFHDPIFAIGSGREYAMAAMHLGRSAREAVELACIYDPNCGRGIDELKLD
jgi:20S proteasome alpha/beta subunit